jgi:hypothetical protein
LQRTDIILLLTPLAAPLDDGPEDGSDPYEYFGRALSARHPPVQHQSYTDRNGITSTHTAHIRRVKAVIIVVNSAVVSGGVSHIASAHVTRVVARDDKPVVVVLTNSSPELWQLSEDFPTVIQCKDYSRTRLELITSVIFGEV